MIDDAVPALTDEEIKAFGEQLRRLRAAGRHAVRQWLDSCDLGLGGDILLDAPCAFVSPKRGIAEASFRGEMRRMAS